MPEGFHNGYKIPPFVPGDRERTPQSAAAMNELVRALNVLLNPKIQRGTSDSDVISEAGHVITLKGSGDGGLSTNPLIGGTNPIQANAAVGCILIDDLNNNEVTFTGSFSALVYAYSSNGSVFGKHWLKRTAIAQCVYNLYPAPVSWFFYRGANWDDPQPYFV